MALGECDPRCIVDNMHFQGGVHHTQMLFAVFNGRPLSHCCYDMTFTWFRARHDDEFAVIPHASMDWYQPTAEDIGASLLLQVEIDDAVLGCIEHGPLVAGTPHLGLKKRLMEGDPCIDPSVRSRVETLLAAHTAYFTNVRRTPVSICGDGGGNNAMDIAWSPEVCSCWSSMDIPFLIHPAQDTWSLLLDDKRVRLTCESALLPPLEALYAPSVQVLCIQDLHMV
ncbi:hypothetical protein DYB35_009591 [Aphanomyces astaci]|uniref:Uncharacterized protein n=1 Tax=Aphanomyces astaci TaxID=112090 RepID=A0A3R7A4M4_APHAT|nr:hypothetical protein DYB35_009591 [Aphanomyces astaci]